MIRVAKISTWAAGGLLFFMLACASQAFGVTVFAAASTTDAITDIGRLFVEKKMGTFTPSFASSSTLAKQIDQGAPADVFLSANPRWMDFLQERGLLVAGSRTDLLGNRIVLIAPTGSQLSVTIRPGFDLAGLLGEDRLAMGDPDHVPAGIYGKKALEALGVWAAVAIRVARAKDVRAALMLVQRQEAPLGIVYATDAALFDKVKVVGVFPEDTHPPVIYPVAMVAGRSTPEANRFIEFLKSRQAADIFSRYGFSANP